MTRKIFLALGLTLLGGCAQIGVKPWQRDQLARNVMMPDSEGNLSGYHDHIYFSKEGATGGHSASGGGCGCN
jgi:hypothetical protein